jgi:integrase
LLTERKLAVGSVVARVAALRFFFVRTLKRRDFWEELPYPKDSKDRRRLPTVLSLDEVARLIDAAGNLMQRTLLMTLYGTGMRRTELSLLKVRDIDSRRMMIRVERGKGGGGRDLPLSPALLEPKRVLRYLGRYTHRVAISNQRLLSFDGQRVSFRWKDYAHGNKQRIMALSASEFLRRFCQHVLPRGFVRIRHFGYLASVHRTSLLALARLQLDCQPLPSSHLTNSPLAIWRCPRCGANMNIGPNLTAQQLAYRCKLTDSS